MTKAQQIILSLGAIIGGMILCGYALATTLGHPTSTICIVLGLVFSVLGFISLILILKQPTGK